MRTTGLKLKMRCASLAAALLLVTATASPALGLEWQEEDGYRYCGALLAYLHFRYNDYAVVQPPGGTLHVYSPQDGLWHVNEVNGGYGGYWYAMSTPYLDKPNTWAGCRNYG